MSISFQLCETVLVPSSQHDPPSIYTGGSALIEALNDAGISHIFVNYGSDHPAIMEGICSVQEARKTRAESDHQSERDGGAELCAGLRATDR